MRRYLLMALLLAGLAIFLFAVGAHSENKCQYGSWDDEAKKATFEGWRYDHLSPDDFDRVLDAYKKETHEKIEATQAWVETFRHFGGPLEYSVVFADDAGCIVFRVNVAGGTRHTKKKPTDSGI